jgi:membrane-associated protease RseP (regulator of RpoE activity)
MRKYLVVGLLAVVALSLTVGGVILAQGDDNDKDGSPWLGITLRDTDEGVRVLRVQAGSPAAAAGVVNGDVIVSFDGEAVESAEALIDMVQSHDVGDVVSLAVLRNDVERTLEVELGRTGRSAVGAPAMIEWALGVDLEETEDGYEVVTAHPLQAGDVITAINGQSVEDLDWSDLAESDDPALTLTVLRDGEEIDLEISLFNGHGLRGGWFGGGFDKFGGRSFGDHSFGGRDDLPGRGRDSWKGTDRGSTEASGVAVPTMGHTPA